MELRQGAWQVPAFAPQVANCSVWPWLQMYALLLVALFWCCNLPQAQDAAWPQAAANVVSRALHLHAPSGTCSPLIPLFTASHVEAAALLAPRVALQVLGLFLLMWLHRDLWVVVVLALRYAASPFTPRLRLLKRQDWIKYAHGLGYAVKSATVKHAFYPERCKPIFTSVAPPKATAGQRVVHVLLACMLFAGTTATAMQVGQAVNDYPTLASTFRLATAGVHLEQAVTTLQQRDGLSFTAAAVPIAGAAAAEPPPTQQQTPATDCVTPFTPHGAVVPDPHASKTEQSEHGWRVGNHPDFTPELRAEVDAMLLERKHKSFAYSLKDMPGYCGADGDFKIELTTDKPIIAPRRRYSPAECRIRDEKCCELRDAGFIVPAPPNCPYQCAPTMPFKKAPDGTWTDHRFCIDYRPINAHTKPDRYGLHLPEDLFNQVGNSRVYSVIDLKGAFTQIPVADDGVSREATCFMWGNERWVYTRMPFGLVNGSAKCQRVLDTEIALAGLRHCAFSYVDDCVCHSPCISSHREHVAAVLDMLHDCGLRAHPQKCTFFVEHVEFLGHNLSPEGLSPHEAKVAAIRALSSPANLTELRSKLAFINYYRCYVPNFSTIAAPLYALTRADAVWEWGPVHEEAFQSLKDIVCMPGVVLKRFDENLPTTVYTDWSGVGIAAVLAQHSADGEHMVACISRSLNKHEKNLSATQGELLAAVWGVKSFRHYLHGLHFTLVTDHQPLKWLMGTPDLSGKHARWALILQEFEFEVKHRPGKAHANVDVPSRYPLQTSHDPTGACLDPVLLTEPAALPHPFVSLAASMSHSPASLSTTTMPGTADEAAAGVRCARASPAVSRWLNESAFARHAVTPACQPWAATASSLPDVYGVYPTAQLCTAAIGPAFLEAASEEGIVLYEPFGGLCAALDAVLANNIAVHQYYYSDIDPAAQQVAHRRVQRLHARHPALFPVTAFAAAFSTLPMDVRKLDTAALVAAGATAGRQWLVVAGWSCEDLSPAGRGAGLAGKRSSNFSDVVRIVGALQQLQSVRPPAFVLENAAMQAPWGHRAVREKDFPRICATVGQPVLLDAAQFGSYAHRLRNFWSNLSDPQHVSAVAAVAQRKPHRYVNAVLDPGRRAQQVTAADALPHYQCNQVGEPMAALPTLVAYPASRAFRGEGKGLLFVEETKHWVEPNPDERERILGYETGTTRVGAVTEAQRHAITGRAMDRYALVSLFCIYMGLAGEAWETSQCSLLSAQAPGDGHFFSNVAAKIMMQQGWRQGRPLGAPSAVNPIVEPIALPVHKGTAGLGYTSDLGGGIGSANFVAARSATSGHNTAPAAASSSAASTSAAAEQQHTLTQAFENLSVHSCAAPTCSTVLSSSAVYSEADLHHHLVATAAAVSAQEEQHRLDPTADSNMIAFLREGVMPTGLDRREADRVRARAKGYRWGDQGLLRVMPDGAHCTVPPPEQRYAIIMDTHERTAHWGTKRTRHLLLASYWWPGMDADVAKALATCAVCAQVKANFNADRPELQPLPIEGLFYRFGVDFAGPFARSKDGNAYVLIMIDHFSKQIELVATPNKEARTTANAFLAAVIGRYGACAEVVTDRGTEFEGEFAQLLEDCLIDHRVTSPNHPQADGLAERCVQSMKKALMKHVVQHRDLGDWDVHMHWVQLGYRASKQAATNLSPYELLYGTRPIIPPAIRERVESPLLDFADPEQAAEFLLYRAELLRERCAEAMSNLRIAQHRDKLRYQIVRSGQYEPSGFKFVVGDFVYLRRRTVVNSLQPEARPGILRIVEVRPSGVLVLQGRCGTRTTAHISECAPCHLSNINPTLDPTLQRVGADFPCSVCGSPDDEEIMLICDGCFQGFHLYCLSPPLAAVPEGDTWLCSNCLAQGLTEQAVYIEQQQNLPVAQSDTAVFPSVAQRERDAQAQSLHGRRVLVEGQEGVLVYVPRVERPAHSRSPLAISVAGQPLRPVSYRKAMRLLAE